MELTVNRIDNRDLKDLRTLMLAEALPVETILSAPVQFYEIATASGARIGWGGLEIYGEHAVVRSVVIKAVLRKTGAGRLLIKALIDVARSLGLKKLWLLTISAEVFFEKMGFKHALRTDAPKEIQACEEFTWAHNETAHCMNMKL